MVATTVTSSGGAVAALSAMYPLAPDIVDRDPADVARRVREEREKAGLSHAQLAAMSGLTKSYLVRLETLGGNPTIAALGAVADALGLTIADLVRAPKITLTVEEADIPPSLRAYADAESLTSREVDMLASIRWRKGEQPRTEARWRFVHDSLRASRQLDPRPDAQDADAHEA